MSYPGSIKEGGRVASCIVELSFPRDKHYIIFQKAGTDKNHYNKTQIYLSLKLERRQSNDKMAKTNEEELHDMAVCSK